VLCPDLKKLSNSTALALSPSMRASMTI
jgi:hypothetical protein